MRNDAREMEFPISTSPRKFHLAHTDWNEKCAQICLQINECNQPILRLRTYSFQFRFGTRSERELEL